MTIRPAELSDAVALGWLLVESLDDAPSADRGPDDFSDDPVEVGSALVERAMRRNHRLLVADVPEGLCGVVRLAPRELLRSRHVADLDLLVHPVARRLGVGSALAGIAVRTAVEAPEVSKLSARVAADDEVLAATLDTSGPWGLERVERAALSRDARLVDVEIRSLWVEGAPRRVEPARRPPPR
ncbi:MAG: N-acetyltransferase family protein [Myxococcota bacterium]